MSTPSFFDSVSLRYNDEINLSLIRRDSDHYDSVLSLRGRVCSFGRTITHALGIGLKPLYYLGFYVLSRQSVAILRYIPRDALEQDPHLREHQDELRLVRSLIDNPELVERVKRELNGMPLCALVAPFTQTVQVLKSVLGIFHPGLYYQHDPFIAIFAQLAAIAKEVGCSAELCKEFDKGSAVIHEALQNNLSNREYYYEAFRRDFAFICEKFTEKKIHDDAAPAPAATKGAGAGGAAECMIPKARQLSLLTILDPRGTKSGINGCAPALGRLLQHICSHLTIPDDPFEAIIHLSSLCKAEVIDRMVIVAEATTHEACKAAGRCDHTWENIVNAMAHDPSHRANGFIVALGRTHLHLPPEVIVRAHKDCMAERTAPLTSAQEMPVVEAFYTLFYTDNELRNSVRFQLNSHADGSPGLKLLRVAVFQILAERLQLDDPHRDTSFEAVQLYYEHGGLGSPSDVQFTDLNDAAVEAVLRYKWPGGLRTMR